MYHQNNIEFRIASADAIGKFKTDQAHTFLQVCRKEFEFSLSAREVVLLCYDRFSALLLKLEKEFVHEDRRPSARLINFVNESLAVELSNILQTCQNHPDVFGDITAYVEVIHGYTVHIMNDALAEAMTQVTAKAFVRVVEIFSEYLQHILIAMHEYNNNLVHGAEPFICISNFSLMSTTPRMTSLTARASFFRERLGNKGFLLKNYTDTDLSSEVIMTLAAVGIATTPEHMKMAA